MKDTDITQRIKNKYTESQIKKVKLNIDLNVGLPTDEEIDQQVEEVFNRIDFKRHVLETARELDLDEKICEKVIKHYIRSTVGFFYKIHNTTTRILIYTMFRVTFTNNIFNLKSKYYYKKHPLLIKPSQRKKINEILKKHLLKTESYEQSKF